MVTVTNTDLNPTRYSLLSRLQDWDDQDSWRDFFDTYWRLIYSVAIKSGLTETEAQDVVQETVVCVAKDIGKFKRDRDRGSFRGWLRNLTRWRINDQLRKRTPLRVVENVDLLTELHPVAQIPDPAGSELDAIWEEEWKTNLLDAAMERVKRRVREEQYQIFDLYVLRRWKAREVAEALGVSMGRVYLAKHRVASEVKNAVRELQKKWS
jgi:RNA polymerase sigma-70 factor (ECF subfamily)